MFLNGFDKKGKESRFDIIIKIDGLGFGFVDGLHYLFDVTIHQSIGITIQPLLSQGFFQPFWPQICPI